MKLVILLIMSLVSLTLGGPLKESAVQNPLAEMLTNRNNCKDGKTCPTSATCCSSLNDESRCCAYPNAVCCSDGLHCCPVGYQCNITSNTCMKGDEMLDADLTRMYKNVICPDGQSECPDGNTCCKLSSGKYGCCPLPNAVCCSDGQHCCPSGYTCDVSSGTCTRGNSIVPWYEKSPATPVKVESVVCPDGQSECPDGNTCCKLSSGQYGCCPLPNAVCCSDGEHCCPSGYTCDVSAGTCSRGNSIVSWYEKSSATPINVESVICPDGQSECPDGNTCCKLSSGQYGCCPLPNAVCCSDGQHCCPSGYTCDISSGTCSRGDNIVKWTSKLNANSTIKKLQTVLSASSDIICPDGKTSCPSSNTCCSLGEAGKWGCCPVSNAVCCEDHIHCCPSGYSCGTHSCQKGSKHLPFLTKSTGLLIIENPNVKDDQHLLFQPDETISHEKSGDNIMCPDEKSSCPSGSTCCQTPGNIYGCCPYQAAICCADLIHCCPSGYSCDNSIGTCTKDDHIMPWANKLPPF